MSLGLVGRKIGMTRLFLESGSSVPVTVIQVEANRVVQNKTKEVDGYEAIQVAVGATKAHRLSKALAGHFAKASVTAAPILREFRIENEKNKVFALGQSVDVSLFAEGQLVDVTGISKGKGFAGCVKRHGFRTQDATHGNSVSHRVPGSIGQNQTPGRVFKGKKMAGHMGAVQRTTQNLMIVRTDGDKQLLLVKGAIPGATGSLVIVKAAAKTKKAAA